MCVKNHWKAISNSEVLSKGRSPILMKKTKKNTVLWSSEQLKKLARKVKENSIGILSRVSCECVSKITGK